jgi:hypothetical protein
LSAHWGIDIFGKKTYNQIGRYTVSRKEVVKMSLFEKLKQQAGVAAQAAGSVAQTAVQQTKSLASIGRVKLAIASEEDKLKKAYTELGRLFYRDYEAQTEADMEDYLPWCGKVSDAKAEIQKLQEELARIRAEEPEEEPVIVITETPGPEPVPEVPATEETAEPAAAPEEAPETAPEEATEGTPEAPETPENIPEEPPIPQVGTLYVDVTGTEE